MLCWRNSLCHIYANARLVVYAQHPWRLMHCKERADGNSYQGCSSKVKRESISSSVITYASGMGTYAPLLHQSRLPP